MLVKISSWVRCISLMFFEQLPNIRSALRFCISFNFYIYFACSLSWISIPCNKYWSSLLGSIISRGLVELSLILFYKSVITSLYSCSLDMYLSCFSTNLDFKSTVSFLANWYALSIFSYFDYRSSKFISKVVNLPPANPGNFLSLFTFWRIFEVCRGISSAMPGVES